MFSISKTILKYAQHILELMFTEHVVLEESNISTSDVH
jgi:hypothetical protein